MIEIGKAFDIPLVATNNVHYHDPNRRALQDVLTCIRQGCTIDQAGYRIFPNGERFLKCPEKMHRLFSMHSIAIDRGLQIAERCSFRMDELKYEYPDEIVPAGMSTDGISGGTYMERGFNTLSTRHPRKGSEIDPP